MTLILIWWYSELERRLLVLRRQLPSESTILSFSPLAFWFYLELAISSIHVPIFSKLENDFSISFFLRSRVAKRNAADDFSTVVSSDQVHARAPSDALQQNDGDPEESRQRDNVFEFLAEIALSGSLLIFLSALRIVTPEYSHRSYRSKKII